MSRESALILALKWQLEKGQEEIASLRRKYNKQRAVLGSLESVAAFRELRGGGSAWKCARCDLWFNSEHTISLECDGAIYCTACITMGACKGCGDQKIMVCPCCGRLEPEEGVCDVCYVCDFCDGDSSSSEEIN